MRTPLARISLTVLVFVTLLAGVSCIALAVGGDPQTLFTADITHESRHDSDRDGAAAAQSAERGHHLHRHGHLLAQPGLHSVVMGWSLSP